MEATSVASREIVHELLTKDNYSTWRALVKNYLVGQGLWGVVKSPPVESPPVESPPVESFPASSQYESEYEDAYESEYEDASDIEKGPGLGGVVQSFSNSEQEVEKEASKLKEAKALHIIQISCGREILDKISQCKTAKEAWNHLHTEYGSDLKTKRDKIKGVLDDRLGKHKKLYRLVERGNSNIRELLLNTGDLEEAISSATAEGRTLLHFAVIAGHVENVKCLVEVGKEPLIEKKDKYGYTALALVAHYTGNTKIAKCLVEKKKGEVREKQLSMNIKQNNEIPLLLAAANGHKKMTRYLFSRTPLKVMDSDPIQVSLLTRCITAEIFDVALMVLQNYPRLPQKSLADTRSILFALATKPSAFPSGCQFAIGEQFIYDLLSVEREFQHKYQIPDVTNIKQFLANFAAEGRRPKTSCAGWFYKLVLSILFLLVLQPAKLLVRLLRGIDCLNFFGIRKIYEKKYTHYEVLGILMYLHKNVAKFGDEQLKEVSAYETMLYATKHGIIEFLNAMKKANPDLLWAEDKDKRGTFSHAILNRQPDVFRLIHGLSGWREIFRHCRDVFGNNLLHMAGHVVPTSDLDSRFGAALQMQREIQWFKAVEEVVHPKCKEEKNVDGKKPHEVFTENHKELVKDGAKWAKETAGSFTLVGTLIITILFTAAFTLPGGNNQDTGVPIFLHNKIFTVFIIADAISLFTSVTSVLIFIGILTSRFAEKDFLSSLPRKLLWGLIFLFLSVVSMIVAFCAALFIILKGYDAYWRVALGITLPVGSIPIIVLVISQSRIMVEIFRSTWSNSLSYTNKQG